MVIRLWWQRSRIGILPVKSIVPSNCCMPLDNRAYLADIIESCDAIQTATRGLDLQSYQENRLVRSSVEREFIIIGEAVAALARIAPPVFSAITPARRIVDFRNQVNH